MALFITAIIFMFCQCIMNKILYAYLAIWKKCSQAILSIDLCFCWFSIGSKFEGYISAFYTDTKHTDLIRSILQFLHFFLSTTGFYTFSFRKIHNFLELHFNGPLLVLKVSYVVTGLKVSIFTKN